MNFPAGHASVLLDIQAHSVKQRYQGVANPMPTAAVMALVRTTSAYVIRVTVVWHAKLRHATALCA